MFDEATVRRLVAAILTEHPEGLTSAALREAVKTRYLAEGGTWTADLDARAGAARQQRWVNVVAWVLARWRASGRFEVDQPVGFYRMRAAPTEADRLQVEGGVAATAPEIDAIASELLLSPADLLAADQARVVGDGREAVYAYQYPGLEDRLKIGAASRDPVERIMQQLGTASPAWPRLCLLIRCDNARRLESLIHRWLDELGRRIDAQGREWFRVTVSELEALHGRIRAPFGAEEVLSPSPAPPA